MTRKKINGAEEEVIDVLINEDPADQILNFRRKLKC